MNSDQNRSSINQEILRRLNREVTIKARHFASSLLSNVFRAIFMVEKSSEISDPEAFELDHDPQRILWKRVSEYQLKYFPLAILNQEILSSRSIQYSEYDFFVIADASQSMMLQFWNSFGGSYDLASHTEPDPRTSKVKGDRTKLFLLKYTMASFLYAAEIQKFRRHVYLFNGEGVREYDSKKISNLPELLLSELDNTFIKAAKTQKPETSGFVRAVEEVISWKKPSIVLVLSDFRDCLHHVGEERPKVPINQMLRPLIELSERNRLLVLQINDLLELEPQEEDIHVFYKNCPYLHPENYDYSGSMELDNAQIAKFKEESQNWVRSLYRTYLSFGIPFQHLIAGKNDERIDKYLYELGAIQT